MVEGVKEDLDGRRISDGVVMECGPGREVQLQGKSRRTLKPGVE